MWQYPNGLHLAKAGMVSLLNRGQKNHTEERKKKKNVVGLSEPVIKIKVDESKKAWLTKSPYSRPAFSPTFLRSGLALRLLPSKPTPSKPFPGLNLGENAPPSRLAACGEPAAAAAAAAGA